MNQTYPAFIIIITYQTGSIDRRAQANKGPLPKLPHHKHRLFSLRARTRPTCQPPEDSRRHIRHRQTSNLTHTICRIKQDIYCIFYSKRCSSTHLIMSQKTKEPGHFLTSQKSCQLQDFHLLLPTTFVRPTGYRIGPSLVLFRSNFRTSLQLLTQQC